MRAFSVDEPIVNTVDSSINYPRIWVLAFVLGIFRLVNVDTLSSFRGGDRLGEGDSLAIWRLAVIGYPTDGVSDRSGLAPVRRHHP